MARLTGFEAPCLPTTQARHSGALVTSSEVARGTETAQAVAAILERASCGRSEYETKLLASRICLSGWRGRV